MNDLFAPATQFNGLTFSATAGAFVLSGNSITLGANVTNSSTSLQTINLGLILSATRTFAATAGDITVGGAISGTGFGVTTSGTAHVVTLSGANTYSGATSVGGSNTLAGIGANAFGSTTGITLAGSSVLSLRGDTSTSFVKASDSSSYSVTAASGSFINVDQATGAGTGAKTMTIGNIGTTSTAAAYILSFTGANNTGLTTGAITGPASIAAGTTSLNNTNTTGTTTIGGYTSANTVGGETLQFGSSAANGVGNTTVNGAITPSATTLSLVKNGTGTLTLNGNGAYTGGTTINANGGTVKIGNASALGAAGSNVVLSNGTTLQYALDSAVNSYVVTGGGAAGGSNRTIILDRATAGAAVNQNITSFAFAGSVTSPGETLTTNVGSNVNSGTPTLTIGTILANGLSGSIVHLAGNANYSIGNITPIASTGASNRVTALFFDGTASGNQVTGTISNTPGTGTGAGFTNVSTPTITAGTWTFSGANTYTGLTTVSGGQLVVDSGAGGAGRLGGTTGITLTGGTLRLAQSGAASTDRINDAATITLSGGTFNLNGFSEGAAGVSGVGNLSLTATSTFDFGTIGTANRIQFNGVGTQTNGQSIQIVNWEGTPGSPSGLDQLLFNGAPASFTALYTQSEVSFNGVNGYGIMDFGGFYEVYGVAIPEPGTWAMFVLGGLVLIGFQRVRRRA